MFSSLRLEKTSLQRRAHFSFKESDRVCFLALLLVKGQVLTLLLSKVLDLTEVCVLRERQVAVHLMIGQDPLFMQLHYDLSDFLSIRIQEGKLRECSQV